ncbi:hypothetical protein PDE_08763 [Penicillium oxalicum 114-2]|uniref:Glucose-methanol-choline oxidoreductase N-terminal domain-containing protein n=1 Tax=Penicillium oxalicum (strain 114-2 / CGMCC 5302) TaxID=933388 RepID=S7ZYD0_PENO1|nr:hypothetical protein PDE_08763 [Penicillium oxalicum 114-2]
MTDYLIVGGGTAGLVVAARLSEDPNVKVTVLESGPDRTYNDQVQDPKMWRALSGTNLDWKVKMAPAAKLNNRRLDHPAGRVLGGSSVINGMAYVAPSPAGIDAWAKLGNPNWTWKSLKPYFNKSITVNMPDSLGDSLGPQPAAHGPVQLSFPAVGNRDNNTLLNAWNTAFKNLKYEFNPSVLPEKPLGIRPYVATIDPKTGLRSGADRGYGAMASARPNVTIITNATVRKILFKHDSFTDAIATGVEVSVNGIVSTYNATKEVILAAGAFNTPKILEHSGIGQRELLQKFRVPVIVNSPGVGENLQNHVMYPIRAPLKEHHGLKHLSPGMKSLALVRVHTVEQKVFNKMHEEEFEGKTGEVVRSLLEDHSEPTACIVLSIASPRLAMIVPILSYPLSRGSCHINAANPYTNPTVRSKLCSKQLDIESLAKQVQACCCTINSPFMQPIFEKNTRDLHVMSIVNDLRGEALPAHHACGTAAMLPKEAGGVVDQNLIVYGTKNLRIVDASIFPLIPLANPLATVYAVAERAADLIKGRTSYTE